MKLNIGITLMVCLFSGILIAQPKSLPDSIRVEFPEHHSIVTFELRQYEKNKSVIKNFPNQWGSLLKHIQNSLTTSEKNKPQQIEVIYSEKETDGERYKISIQGISNAKTKITVGENTITELLPPGWEVTIKMKDAEAHIYAPDLEQLEKLTDVNMEKVIAQLDNDPATKVRKKFGFISRVIVKESEVQTAQTTHRNSADMLGVHAGAGVGLLQDKLYPEFNFTTSIYLANRYKENHQRISLHYELKLFTGKTLDGGYRTMPASFVSASYALNFRKDRPHWSGIGAGLLVYDRSNFFTGKTLKLFLESDIGSSKLNIIPELYLTNDFKQALFGLKLNYKF